MGIFQSNNNVRASMVHPREEDPEEAVEKLRKEYLKKQGRTYSRSSSRSSHINDSEMNQMIGMENRCAHDFGTRRY